MCALSLPVAQVALLMAMEPAQPTVDVTDSGAGSSSEPTWLPTEAEQQIRQARLLSAQTLQRARVLVPALPGIKRLQKILYTQLQRAMLAQLEPDQALAVAAAEWNRYARSRWPDS